MGMFPFFRYLASLFFVYLAYFIVDNALYLSPIIYAEYEERKGLPSVKDWDSPVERLIKKELLHIFESAVYTFIFVVTYYSIPFNSVYFEGFVKGLFFGLGLILIQVIPVWFNLKIRTTYPDKLLFFEMLRGIITKLAIGISLGVSYVPIY